MPEMTPERWERTVKYLREHFAPEDAQLKGLMGRAVGAGMPDIAVGPEAGKLLGMLVMAAGGRRVVEVGTLAGYSTIWMARSLAADGKVVTVDVSSKHLEQARTEAARAGVADRIDFRQGKGSEVLPKLLEEFGPGECDLILLDAERSEYARLVDTAHAMLRRAGLLVVDNALNAKRWTADPPAKGESPDEMDVFNRQIAGDARWSAMVVPIGNGLLIAVKRPM